MWRKEKLKLAEFHVQSMWFKYSMHKHLKDFSQDASKSDFNNFNGPNHRNKPDFLLTANKQCYSDDRSLELERTVTHQNMRCCNHMV